jgi:trigger factor
MQVSIESSTGLERQLKIGVPAERIDQEVTNRLQKATKTVSIKGFRKGKVPLKVVKQHYGKGVRQEVVGEIVNSTFYEAIQQEDLKPVGQPQINELTDKEGQELSYIAVFEVFPEVDLQPLSDVSIERPVAEVKDADVKKMIEQLRDQQSSFKVSKKKAKKEIRSTLIIPGPAMVSCLMVELRKRKIWCLVLIL